MSDDRETAARLRDATTAWGATVRKEDIGPLNLGTVRTVRRRPRFLVPLVAAATVLVCVVAATAVVRGQLTDPATPATPAHAGTPKFYVRATGKAIVVRTVSTGRQTASIPAPSKSEQYVVAGSSPDNRTFFVSSYTESCKPRLFRLVLDDRGRKASFGPSKIKIPADTTPVSIDTTAGNRQVVLGVQACGGGSAVREVMLGDVATGRTRVWKAEVPHDVMSSSVQDVTVSADARWIVYGVKTLDPTASDPDPKFYLLDASKPGNVLGGRELKPDPHARGMRGKIAGLQISPDGKTLLAAIGDQPVEDHEHPTASEKKNDTGHGRPTVTRTAHSYGLVAYDRATLRAVRVVYSWRTRMVDTIQVKSQDASGAHLIVLRGGYVGHTKLGGVAHGRLTPWRGSARAGGPGLAW